VSVFASWPPWARRSAVIIALFLGGAIVLSIVGVTGSSKKLTLTSPAFPAGGQIPARYTCSGADVSPPLRWRSPPARTDAYALVVLDIDAPGGTFVHWLAWNISSDARSLPAGAKPPLQGTNSFGRVGYGGPCPPAGKAHHYVFRLYALDSTLKLPAGSPYSELSRALQVHTILLSQLVGTFGR
jgi:Raf kinase inhibitor-like YbhB/YbcL family protein